MVRLPTPPNPCHVYQWAANARPWNSTAMAGNSPPCLERPLEFLPNLHLPLPSPCNIPRVVLPLLYVGELGRLCVHGGIPPHHLQAHKLTT